MKVTPTAIPDLLIIEPSVFEDDRGFLLETWNKRMFSRTGLDSDFVQDNHSYSLRGILRGLHYQIEQPQGKLVRVMGGTVFDVAVDLRRSSSTFGRWVGEWLSDNDHRMLWVPPGFAHGFLVTSKSAHVLYKCTDYYTPECERTIAWDDPDLAIDWPLFDDEAPSLSQKDLQGRPFRDAEYFT